MYAERAVELASRTTIVRISSDHAPVLAEYHRSIWVGDGRSRTRIVDFHMLGRLVFRLLAVALVMKRSSRG